MKTHIRLYEKCTAFQSKGRIFNNILLHHLSICLQEGCIKNPSLNSILTPYFKGEFYAQAFNQECINISSRMLNFTHDERKEDFHLSCYMIGALWGCHWLAFAFPVHISAQYKRLLSWKTLSITWRHKSLAMSLNIFRLCWTVSCTM